jgi:hypothetical protein
VTSPAFIRVLRKPAQRLWFVAAMFGVIVMIVGIVGYAIDNTPYAYGAGRLDGFFDLVFDRLNFSESGFEHHAEIHAFQRGGILTVVGSVFAYLYDYTLGALI